MYNSDSIQTYYILHLNEKKLMISLHYRNLILLSLLKLHYVILIPNYLFTEKFYVVNYSVLTSRTPFSYYITNIFCALFLHCSFTVSSDITSRLRFTKLVSVGKNIQEILVLVSVMLNIPVNNLCSIMLIFLWILG